MKTRAAWVAILLVGALGCGQKGPLYLPDHAGAVVTRPAAGAQNTGATPPDGTAPPAGSPDAAGSGRDSQVVHKNSGKDDDPAQK